MTKTMVHPSVPQFTTERFYTEHTNQHGILMLERHLNRYKWALRYLKAQNDVLDAGCGSGYGDHILINGCRTVFGIDKSSEAIQYARRKAKKLGVHEGRLTYAREDLANLKKFESIKLHFHVVVCIEVIEHLDELEQHAFMEGVRQLIKPEGIMLVTTPEIGNSPMTEHHKHEFTRGQFERFLSEYFSNVKFDDPIANKIQRVTRDGIESNFILASCSSVRSQP